MSAAEPAESTPSKMKKFVWATAALFFLISSSPLLRAQAAAGSVCPRPQIGSTVEEPPDLRSKNGVLEVNLPAYDTVDAGGTARYCFTDDAGRESPNLRVSP